MPPETVTILTELVKKSKTNKKLIAEVPTTLNMTFEESVKKAHNTPLPKKAAKKKAK